MGGSWGQRVHGRPSRRALGAPLACAVLSFGGLLPGVATASGWSVRRVVEPAGSVSTALAGVSCVSRSVCFGVGQYDGKRSLRTLVERWDGARWTIPKSAPRLAGQLLAVSCSSPSACTAVGASMAQQLVVRWNGKRWFRQGTPSTGSDVSSLAAVSCPGRNLCVAVGHLMSGYYTPSTLVERWNGKRWQIDPSPNAGPADGSISATGDFRGVSCPSARVCVAVGTSGAGAYPPVFARWNGHHWSKMAQPAGPLPFGSITVSCSAVNACTAIGTVWEPTSATATYPVIERWDGTRWSLQHTPRSAPSSTLDGYFGLSCPAARTCAAVGGLVTGGSGRYLIDWWNGASWRIVYRATQPKFSGNTLAGVDCVSARSCVAVGARYCSNPGTTCGYSVVLGASTSHTRRRSSAN